MRRFTMLAICLLALAGLMTTAALAQSPHYVKGPTASIDTQTGDLNVCFKEAGLGSTPVTYTLTASNAVFTFQCFTKSGNQPQGEPNGQSFSNDTNSVTLTPRNGQITGCVSLEPQQGTASCQGNGLRLKLISAEYDNVSFSDTGTGNTLSLGTLGPVTFNPPIPF